MGCSQHLHHPPRHFVKQKRQFNLHFSIKKQDYKLYITNKLREEYAIDGIPDIGFQKQIKNSNIQLKKETNTKAPTKMIYFHDLSKTIKNIVFS